MNNEKLKTISLKLAEAILLYKGEISIDDLKSLPFIDEDDARLIAYYLRNKFNLRTYIQKLQNKEHEEILSII